MKDNDNDVAGLKKFFASQGLLSRGGEDNPLLKKDWSGDPLRMYSTYMLYVTKKQFYCTTFL